MGLKTLGGEDKIFDGLDDKFADISFFIVVPPKK